MDRLIIQLGRSRMILALIIMVGLVFGYMSAPTSEELVVGLVEEVVVIKDDLKPFENFEFNYSILENETYKSLEIFGENPVNPGITGERRNPFAPL